MRPRRRLAWTLSTLFHAGLAAALAARTADPPRPLEVRAGEDSRAARPSLVVRLAPAAPPLLDTPVVVGRHQVWIGDRHLIEVPSQTVTDPLRLDVPPVEMAARLIERLEPAEPPDTSPPDSSPPASSPPDSSPPDSSPGSARADRPPAPRPAAASPGADHPAPVRAVIVPPVFIDPRPPVYPVEARRSGWRGVVLLRITVDPQGAVVRAEVARSSGYPALDAAAVRAVRTWRGRPATRDGVPFRSTWNKPVRFE